MTNTNLHRARLLAALAAAVLPATSLAQVRAGATIRPYVEMSIEGGGAQVAAITFADDNTYSLSASGGATVAIGGILRPAPGTAWSPLGLRFGAGYKWRRIADGDRDITLARIPVEAVVTYAFPPGWHVGAGAVHHANVRASGSELAQGLDLGSATGARLEMGWRFIAGTFTRMSYRDETGRSYDANAVGVSVRWTFGGA